MCKVYHSLIGLKKISLKFVLLEELILPFASNIAACGHKPIIHKSQSLTNLLRSVKGKLTVLENVRQRQQHCCQEIFDKISSQEIFLHLAGNSCHLIYIVSCTQCAWIITIHIIMVSVLKCHIIYLLFKKSKSILLVEIVLC